jgi:hypothetical protein
LIAAGFYFSGYAGAAYRVEYVAGSDMLEEGVFMAVLSLFEALWRRILLIGLKLGCYELKSCFHSHFPEYGREIRPKGISINAIGQPVPLVGTSSTVNIIVQKALMKKR